MGYIIYGKRPQDKKFAALDKSGLRVGRLCNARVFDTKEEAEKVLEKNRPRTDVKKLNNQFEIRYKA